MHTGTSCRSAGKSKVKVRWEEFYFTTFRSRRQYKLYLQPAGFVDPSGCCRSFRSRPSFGTIIAMYCIWSTSLSSNWTISILVTMVTFSWWTTACSVSHMHSARWYSHMHAWTVPSCPWFSQDMATRKRLSYIHKIIFGVASTLYHLYISSLLLWKAFRFQIKKKY